MIFLIRNASGRFMSKMSSSLRDLPLESLEGSRLFLSFWEAEDSEELLFLVDSSRESLQLWLPWVENFRSISDAYAMIDSYRVQREMGRGGALGIRRFADGALIGGVILQWIDWKNCSSALEYFLGSEFEGEGCATEAVGLVLDYLQNLGIHRVEISAAVENVKSNALAKRLGFEWEGMAKDAEFLHGKYLHHNRYGTLLSRSHM